MVCNSHDIFRKVRQFRSILHKCMIVYLFLYWLAHQTFLLGRDLIMQHTSLNGDQMNIINFCMSAASLVGAVIQLAMLSGSQTEDLYREYLGKLACCHFSLVSLCFDMDLALNYPHTIISTTLRACICVNSSAFSGWSILILD